MTVPIAHQINTGDYALVIGINHYPQYENLNGAIDDAEDMVRWLCDEPEGGGLPSDNCIPIYSSAKSARPIQDEIDDAIAKLFETVGNKQQARRLYVYFSGHGMAPSKLVTGMCVANWSSVLRDRALNSQEYLDALLTSGRFREVIMFLDCCRVPMVVAKGRGPGNPNIVPGQGSPKSKSFQANATEFLNKAYEGPVSTGRGDSNVRGYFTRALLEGLRGAAAIEPCGVPASELKKYLERRTPELALADGIDQEPEVSNGLPSKNEPSFGVAKPKPPSPGTSAEPPTDETLGSSLEVPLELYTSVADTRVQVLDNRNKTVFTGKIDFSHNLSLPRGHYTVRGSHKHHRMEHPFKLEKPTRIRVFDPRLYTATTLAGRPSSHEYYTYPSIEWSTKETRPPIAKSAHSSIFIFVRALSREHFQPGTDVAKGLVLLSDRHEEISHFGPRETRRNKKDGWVAFHASAPRGFYYLRCSAPPAWEVPIQLFDGYQAQAFLMYRDGPVFQTLKVFLQKGHGFDQRDHETTAIDIALNGIQNNSDLLSKEALDLLLHGKFRNPMLGLVGAHVLLRREPVDDGIEIVLHNLRRLLPQSTDVAALEILARSRRVRLPQNQKNASFDHPPMLRAGLEAVFAASAKRPSIIVRRSSLPEIAVRMYADTPWSTWQPQPSTTLFDSKRRAVPTRLELTWVHLALLDDIKSRLEHKTRPTINPKQFALQIGVPPQTITVAMHELETISSDFPINEIPPEFRGLPFFSPRKKNERVPLRKQRRARH